MRRALPWHEWPAVQAGRVWVADGNAYFNRPGPRLVESLEILAACVHPEAFRTLSASTAAPWWTLRPTCAAGLVESPRRCSSISAGPSARIHGRG